MTLADFTLDLGQAPADSKFCNPIFAADELLRSYEPLLLESLKPLKVDSVVRHNFIKHGTKAAFNQKSQIAIRLSYCPDRIRGLRVLAFSNAAEHLRRSYTSYDKRDEKIVLSRKDKLLEETFIKKSISFGFQVNMYSQGDGLIMSSTGSWHAGGCLSKVVVEMSLSSTVQSDKKSRPMFRHILHQNPLDRV